MQPISRSGELLNSSRSATRLAIDKHLCGLGVENTFYPPPQHGRQLVSAAHHDTRNTDSNSANKLTLQCDAIPIAAVEMYYRIDLSLQSDCGECQRRDSGIRTIVDSKVHGIGYVSK